MVLVRSGPSYGERPPEGTSIVIERPDNPGYSEAANEGLKAGLAAGARYFVVSNNDVAVQLGTLGQLKAVLEARPDIGAISPVITLYPQTRLVYFAGGTLWGDMLVPRMKGFRRKLSSAYPYLFPSEWLTGAFLMVRREVLESVGLMPEGYFMYMEDVEWSIRMGRAGWKLAVLGKPLVHHAQSMSFGGTKWRLPTSLSARLSARNAWIARRRLHLGWRFYIGQFLVRLPFTLAVATIAGRPELIVAYLQGLREGIRC